MEVESLAQLAVLFLQRVSDILTLGQFSFHRLNVLLQVLDFFHQDVTFIGELFDLHDQVRALRAILVAILHLLLQVVNLILQEHILRLKAFLVIVDGSALPQRRVFLEQLVDAREQLELLLRAQILVLLNEHLELVLKTLD